MISAPTSKKGSSEPPAAFTAQEAPTTFEQQALEAWNDDSIKLGYEDEKRLDAARARVIAFVKDQALLDWLDEPEPTIVGWVHRDIPGGTFRVEQELPVNSHDHGATPAFAPVPAGGGATDDEVSSDSAAAQPGVRPSGGGFLEGGDAVVATGNAASGLDQEPAPLVRVTGGALANDVPTPEDVYKHFEDSLTEQTRAAYGEDLEHLARWLGLPDARAAVTHLFRQSSMQANQLVLGWSNAMTAEGYAPSTRSRRLSALRAAVKLANVFGIIDWKLHVRSPKVQKVRDTRGVEPADVRKMLASCDNTVEGIRDRAIILLLFVLGLRRVEVVRLLVKHYDHVRRRLLVHGKGYERDPNKIKWRDLPVDVDAVLNEWALRAHGAAPQPESALFYGWKNNHRTEGITPRGVHYVVSKLGERVGVDVWPHSFRHAAATTALKNKQSLHDVQSFMRHEDPATTQIYNDDIDNAPGRVADTLMGVLKNEK